MNYAYRLATLCLFFLFANQFISAQCVSGKKVETFGGDTIVYSCPDDQSDIISFKPYTYSTPFIFVITDGKDTIRRISNSGKLDFNGLVYPEYHVYGYSYKGNIKNVIGQHLSIARITDLCYEKSTNYILIIREYPLSPILDAQSFSPLFICAPDGKSDSIEITATFPSRSLHKYVVTDEKDELVAIYDNNKFDADPLNCTTCKAYAISYTGEFTATLGDKITGNLTTDCHALSANFLTFIRDTPRGGIISLSDNQSDLFICSASKNDQTIPLILKNNSAGYTRFVITDTAGVILAVQSEPILTASILSAGICRVYGLTYTGTLYGQGVGKKLGEVVWSNDCYALTPGFVTIAKSLPDGGVITFKGSVMQQLTKCLDETADTIEFIVTGAVGPKQLWVLTDTSDNIISWSATAYLDANQWPVTSRRIYHLSYTGVATLAVGQSINFPASSDCYDYADEFLTIHTDIPNPGALAFTDHSISKFVCANDTTGLVLTVLNQNASRLSLAYILADSIGKIITNQTEASFDFTSLQNGSYSIYAISYAGDLKVEDKFITSALLATGCFKVSDIPLMVIKGEARAGRISFENGKDSVLLCSNTNLVSARLIASIEHMTPFVYVLTDVHDTVVRVLKTDTFNLQAINQGICKFWGLAYTGTLNLKEGDHFPTVAAASGCTDRSSNAIILIKDQPSGGSISRDNGDTTFTICYRDGWPDILHLVHTTSSLLPYQYVATDEQNLILQFNISNTNLELLPSLVKKIYGVSYLGSVNAKIGEDITQTVFASECFELSKNVVHINTEEIRAGTIREIQSRSVIDLCLESATTDTFTITANGATPNVSYAILGIKEDTLQFISNGQLTIADFAAGSTQIFGIAYKGAFLAKPGDKVSAARLVDSCYGISTNSILVRKYKPEAGSISGNGQKEYFLCPGDGQSDFVSLTASGAVPLSYAYLVTNAVDSVIAVSIQSTFDLDTFPIGLCKVYGLSYNGEINASGKYLQDPTLVSGCFDITDDFVKVFKAPADGGRLTIQGGDTSISICVEDLGADTISFDYNSSVSLKYALLVTDAQNRLQSIIQDLSVPYDFNGSDPGVCRVYGVSYGGILTVFRNDNVTTTKLASGCYDLTDNFVTINKSNSGGLCKNIGVTPDNKVFLAVYPNPASDLVKINLKSKYLTGGKAQLSIMNISGGLNKKIILDRQDIDNQYITINSSDLKPGVYFIMFQNGYIFDSIKLTIVR